MGWRLDILSPKNASYPVEKAPVFGNETVGKFGYESKARDMVIHPQPQGFAGCMSHELKGCLGCVETPSIGIDEPDRTFELFGRDFRILTADILSGRILDAVAGEPPPVIDPDFAE